MGRFSDQVHLSIAGFTKNVIYSNLQISQKMADHHYFSFTWHYSGQVKIDAMDQADDTSRYMSSEVIFTFKVNGIKLMAKGIITGLGINYLKGAPDGFQVTGVSHTIILDEMPKSRVFLEKSLQQIACDVFDEEMSDEFYQRNAIQPTYRRTFSHLTQYNETNFDFMKRISARFGQWFYFDGMRMQFGQTKSSNVKLVNNVSLHKFTIQNRLASHKASFGGYDYNSATNIRNASLKTETGSKDRFSSIMNYNQIVVARPNLNAGAYTPNASNSNEIKEMVELENAARDANSVFYSGTSYFPIGLGQTFTIDNKSVQHELIAVEITHRSDINGSYFCDFVAIPADVAKPHYTNPACFAKAESQPAKIKENNDPEGLGRVKVTFNWASGDNKSEWIRMIQPHGGAGKGHYFIPEIGEEVLVGFEGGNVDRPFVMGTHYNGQEKSDYATEKNDIKVIQTRSGNRIISDDATGDVTIESQKGQTIAVIHGDGNIRLKAPKNIELDAGEDIVMTAGKDIRVDAGNNISESAGGYKETTTGLFYKVSVGANYLVNVLGDMFEHITGKKEVEGKDIKERAKVLLIQSTEESVSLKGSKNVNSHSGETSRNS